MEKLASFQSELTFLVKWSLGLLRIEHPLDCDYIIIFTCYVIWIYLYLALCTIMIIDSSLRNYPYMVKHMKNEI